MFHAKFGFDAFMMQFAGKLIILWKTFSQNSLTKRPIRLWMLYHVGRIAYHTIRNVGNRLFLSTSIFARNVQVIFVHQNSRNKRATRFAQKSRQQKLHKTALIIRLDQRDIIQHPAPKSSNLKPPLNPLQKHRSHAELNNSLDCPVQCCTIKV